ncbi:MAG: aminomethyl-transferring glycine dehydrogenase [Leptospiraceae bacterium]|nr:aminomethyl-transferring glycine dehydrogenase [Leptospiraceae bacterium]
MNVEFFFFYVTCMADQEYLRRHLGTTTSEQEQMLAAVGVRGLDELIEETIPASIRLEHELQLSEPLSEGEYLRHIRGIGRNNQVWRSYIGLGYYNTITPAVIQRNIFENPAWYTQYTPYQAEISQGRLESLFNFQTMTCELTGMPIANASLLDEATAAAEAMAMLYRNRPKDLQSATVFLVDQSVLPQSWHVVQERARHLGIQVEIGAFTDDLDLARRQDAFGVLVQYPAVTGSVADYANWARQLKQQSGIGLVVAADLLALCLLEPPGHWGADVVLGSSQRFGVAPGFGGPHAAFFATSEKFTRMMPGRLVGQSLDASGQTAWRLALQTREQHIRREKATSNICTAQALLANMAAMYAVYHGPEGLRNIALRIHRYTAFLANQLQCADFELLDPVFFDTLHVRTTAKNIKALAARAVDRRINLNFRGDKEFTISLDETVTGADVQDLLVVFGLQEQPGDARALEQAVAATAVVISQQMLRTDHYLSQPVFNTYHNETAMMRYLRQLANKDLALDTAMIPLGSCTMKLNAASAMTPLSWPEFASIHPLVPEDQVQGYLQIIRELEQDLAHITGLAATSLQPNSGAQGEFAGLLAIKGWHQSRGENHRDIALIPVSAHGTNPASANMAGMQVKLVNCDELGNVDRRDLEEKASQYADRLACLMITYPSTHGVFEEGIRDLCQIVHEHGGQVYMDGANLNAQLGLTSPGQIGADVCHLNLHKTFAIPHGGGGPGMGPICVASHLIPFLPGDPMQNSSTGVGPISQARFGSASILLISYGYIKMLGAEGLGMVTRNAILNANYLKTRLEQYYKVLYSGPNGRIAHEMILDMRPFKTAGIEVDDVAKRLIDYGFHAPTMSFPVPGTLMIEPTESEPLAELDRFCTAMISIKNEIDEIIGAKVAAKDSLLKTAPHTAEFLLQSGWPAEKQKQAAYPLHNLAQQKYWPPVARIDNTYGDRNLLCSCPPVTDYIDQE